MNVNIPDEHHLDVANALQNDASRRRNNVARYLKGNISDVQELGVILDAIGDLNVAAALLRVRRSVLEAFVEVH